MLKRIGLKLQPCLSPIFDENDFVIPLGKRTLRLTLLYIFSGNYINITIISYITTIIIVILVPYVSNL